MKNKLREFFTVPAAIRPAFWRDTVQRNRLSLLVYYDFRHGVVQHGTGAAVVTLRPFDPQ